MIVKRFECDVCVIGAGGAALRAAIAAFEQNPDSRVLLVDKGRIGATGTTATSCSDRMAYHATLPHTEPQGPDNWKYHADDIYRIGGKVSDYKLAATLARNSGESLEYLLSLGVPFAMRGDVPDQFVTDGSQYARACYTGPYTANHIWQALYKRAQQLPIERLNDAAVVELVVDGGRVVGALALDGDDRIVSIAARAVILATGGAGSAFEHNVFPPGMTGDGFRLALEAGANLVNMEFIQIGLSNPQTALACSGSMMRALPRVVNDLNEEFLIADFERWGISDKLYDTLFEKGASWPISCEHLSSRIDISVFRQILAGRSVYLDYSKNPANFDFGALSEANRARYLSEVKAARPDARGEMPIARLWEINPPVIQWLYERGISVEAGDRVQIVPAIQHFQGGVKIDECARASVPGLYAAGECAGGQHGANRPGGNALMDSQVFGRIAGRQAAADAAHLGDDAQAVERAAQALAQRIEALGQNAGNAAEQALAELRLLLSRSASVVRTLALAEQALDELGAIDLESLSSDTARRWFELRSVYDVARLVLTAISLRRESRGPHLFFEEPDSPLPLANDAAQEVCYVLSKDGCGIASEVYLPDAPPGGGDA